MDAAGSDVPSAITNVAGYRFVDLVDLDRLQSVFRSVCLDLGLKGTVLLAPEGLNFFVAGPVSSIDGFVEFLERDERFAGIDLKRSLTDYQPFNRLNIRKKKEIISVGLDHIRPADATGARISPQAFNCLLYTSPSPRDFG